jgi:hypothetical protein
VHVVRACGVAMNKLFGGAICLLIPLFACGRQISAISPSITGEKVNYQQPTMPRSYRVGANGKSLELINSASGKLERACVFQSVISQAKLSFDGSAVIVSENTYVPTKRLLSCRSSPVTVYGTPISTGMLVDINIKSRLYIALLPVATQPYSYLATVGTVGLMTNIISLPGAYIAKQSHNKQLESAFSYSEDGGPTAKISLNGKYVSVNGVIDCSEDAYPGVWDVKNNRKVNLIEEGFPGNVKCQSLFLSKD